MFKPVFLLRTLSYLLKQLQQTEAQTKINRKQSGQSLKKTTLLALEKEKNIQENKTESKADSRIIGDHIARMYNKHDPPYTYNPVGI